MKQKGFFDAQKAACASKYLIDFHPRVSIFTCAVSKTMYNKPYAIFISS